MTYRLTRRSGLLAGAASVLSASWLRTAVADETGTLTVALSTNPVTCDPINSSSHDWEIISESIFENLVEFDIDGNLKPQLAKALPEISADALVYTFDLRDDVLFHDGTPMTSEDIKYSLEYIINPANKASRGPIFNRLSHVETDGPHRVHVHLKVPFAPWTAFLTKFMGVFPKGSREKYGNEYFRVSPKGVGTGPAMFEEWKPNDYISMRRNPHYWQKGLPHWDRVVVKIVPEDATRVAYLLAGQADIIGAPPAREFSRLKTRKGIQGAAVPTFGGWTVMFQNISKPPFDDIEFRRCIQHAVDRKTIADKIYYGLVEPSGIPAPASAWWYDKQADEMTAYNPDLAKQHLAKSRYPNGTEFEMEVSAEPYLLDAKDAAVFVQSELAKLNIKVNLRVSSSQIVQSNIMGGTYQSGLANFMSPGEATYFLMASFTANSFMSKTVGNFTDPEVAAALKIAFAETDREKLKPVYAKLMRYLADTSYFTWIGYFAAANLWRDRVKNFRPSRGLTINVYDVSMS
ncbi:MAG TPA: ABC transporter substrate-binding protein [Acetobacteraceae bacterium]|jgi:peptide/nickel transport system substrate-binding protein|nr:ABC transporter substrate-binding protein [Acetobacteraceae bacterium]HEX4365508.1 ABC transporter substrate-binding protein [Rhodopila sp.]